ALGMFFFLLYYFLLSAAWVFGEVGLYPPLIGMWVPNLLMGGVGLCLIVWTAKERALPIAAGLHFLKRITAKFRIPVR
ncbi:MAG: LPS export ABC transporter permease LptF, partial [Deltaproteobacteria bacterium]|nr:LPS export ABC transporter permease LptF [Deltaproteobacteria bacterium]